MTTQKLYLVWIFSVVIAIPLALKLVPPNGFVGFRFATRDPVVWKNVNSFAGWSVIVCSIAGGLYTYFKPTVAEESSELIVAGFLGIAVFATIIYFLIGAG